MRNILRRSATAILATILTTVIATVSVYAWYTYIYKGSASITGVAPAEPASSSLLLSETTNGHTADFSFASEYPLYPCTKCEGFSFKNDIGYSVTSDAEYVAKRVINIKAANTATGLRVQSIELTGDGKDDEINKSLRVGIGYGETKAVYAPLRDPDYTQELGTVYDYDTPIYIYLWYEGTDEANTSGNAVQSKGAVQVKINLSTE